MSAGMVTDATHSRNGEMKHTTRLPAGLIQRTCACGKVLDPDEKRSLSLKKKLAGFRAPLSIRPKLAISQPDDPYEQEADRMAAMVMRMPEPAVRRKPACPPGKGSGCRDDEDTIKEGPVQRKAIAQPGQVIKVPHVGNTVLQSPGEPLDRGTRAFFEPRFGYDFSQVRIHTDTKATESADVLGAQAFTAGNGIFFAQGLYAPDTRTTRELLAHELSHIIQQGYGLSERRAAGKKPPGAGTRHPLKEDLQPRVAPAGGRFIHRKVVVQKPDEKPDKAPAGVTNAGIVNDYIGSLCSGFSVDPAGLVRSSPDTFCTGASKTSTPESCLCLCSMTALRDKTGNVVEWKVFVADDQWPHTHFPTRSVYVQSPYSGMQFGAWSAGPDAHRLTQSNWLVLGHELCGHGWLYERGEHPKNQIVIDEGRLTHDSTVEIENKIAQEHGIPPGEQRGLWASGRHHGESLASVTIARFPSGSADVYAVPPDERAKINIARDFMKSTSVAADVIGHADKPAKTSTANEKVSKKRAENVRDVLVSRGIRSDRFQAVTGKADTECTAPGDQPQCRKAVIYMFNYLAASDTHS